MPFAEDVSYTVLCLLKEQRLAAAVLLPERGRGVCVCGCEDIGRRPQPMEIPLRLFPFSILFTRIYFQVTE